MLYFHIDFDADGSYRKNFRNVFEPVERILVPLNFAWRSAKNLSIVRSSNNYSAAFDRVSNSVWFLLVIGSLFAFK